MFLGGSFEILDDQLTAGLALTMPFAGGGDYTSGEEAGAPPYTSHQRYFGVNTKIITGQVIPALSYTPVVDWGLHLGLGMTYTIDIFQITKSSNVGQEGLGGSDEEPAPYSTDAVLTGETKGSHMGFTAGVFFDKFEKAQLGISYTSGGEFNGKGTGEVTFPGFLVENGKPKTLDADLEIAMKLPAIWRMSINSQINEKFNVGATIDHYRWNACCGDEGGDIAVKLTDKKGKEVGKSDDDVLMSVDKEIYSPRRLWDASNYTLFAGYQANNNIWLGGRFAYNQNAVPDYAVSPTNLDFENVGFQIGSRYTFGEPEDASRWTVGVSYSKFFLYDRNITGSAWNGGGPDERFSPTEAPFNVSSDGHYEVDVDIVGLRVEWAN
jgi:long-subunit fatty acid transport protein